MIRRFDCVALIGSLGRAKHRERHIPTYGTEREFCCTVRYI